MEEQQLRPFQPKLEELFQPQPHAEPGLGKRFQPQPNAQKRLREQFQQQLQGQPQEQQQEELDQHEGRDQLTQPTAVPSQKVHLHHRHSLPVHLSLGP